MCIFTNYKKVNNELKTLYNFKNLRVFSFQETRNEITDEFLNELQKYETIVVIQQNEENSEFENDTTTLRRSENNLFYFNNSNIVEFFEQFLSSEDFKNKLKIEKNKHNEKIVYTTLKNFFSILFEENVYYFDLLIIY